MAFRVAQMHLLDPFAKRSFVQTAAAGGDEVRTWEGAALAGIMMVAFGLRQYLLGMRPLWLDEAYSLGVAGRGFRDILAFLRVADAHPLGYYAFLSVWIRWFGTGLAEARFPSLVLGLVAVFLTWRIGRQLFSPRVGIVAAAVVALNPFQIIAANEIRMYPLLECLALASTWIAWRAVRSPEVRWWWIGYGLSVAAMAYTSYYSFFLIPGQVLWVWLSHSSRRQALANLSIAGAAAAVCYLPWVPYVLAAAGRGVPWRQPFQLDYVLGVFTAQTFGGYLFNAGNYHAIGVGLPFTYALLLLVPFLALMGVGIAAFGQADKAARLLIGLCWACPLVLVMLASVAQGGIAAFPRHLVFLEPFAALLLAGGIVQVWYATAAAPGVVRPLLGCLLIAAFGYPAMAQFNPVSQYYRYDLAAGFVQARYRPGDALVYFPAGTDLAFRYYFSPPGPQIHVLTERDRWSRAALQPAIRKAADSVAVPRIDRVWLIYSLPWPRGSLSDLVQAVTEKNYRAGPSWDFRGLWVTLLTRVNASTP